MQQNDDPTPDGFFKLEELQTFKSLQGEQLADVNYFFWHHASTPEVQFLLFIEILFVSEHALILTSGEDTDALRIIEAMDLIQQARQLMERGNGEPAVRQLNASGSAIWMPLLGQKLQGIHLSKDPSNQLYVNDALLLQFEDHGVVVALNEKGGMGVSQS